MCHGTEEDQDHHQDTLSQNQDVNPGLPECERVMWGVLSCAGRSLVPANPTSCESYIKRLRDSLLSQQNPEIKQE